MTESGPEEKKVHVPTWLYHRTKPKLLCNTVEEVEAAKEDGYKRGPFKDVEKPEETTSADLSGDLDDREAMLVEREGIVEAANKTIDGRVKDLDDQARALEEKEETLRELEEGLKDKEIVLDDLAIGLKQREDALPPAPAPADYAVMHVDRPERADRVLDERPAAEERVKELTGYFIEERPRK